MTNKTVSRRNFIKMSALSLGSLAFTPRLNSERPSTHRKLARVAIVDGQEIRDSVSVHRSANDESVILYQRFRDDLVNVYYEVNSEHGPEYNPIWYRVWGGYIHRGHLQDVEYVLNPVASAINEDRQLGEITVPFSRSMIFTKLRGWEPAYRLYYETTHWIFDIVTGPDGQPWYKLQDEAINNIDLFIPAPHMRIVKDSELEPISPDVPPGEKWIDISIARQVLTAYEDDKVALQTKISSGVLTEAKQTPLGEFRMNSTYPSKHMGNGDLTDKITAYELVGVPWTCFFNEGIATHGTYWHTNFGIPMSSGCINMWNNEAKWLYRWVTPSPDPHKKYTIGSGTRVIVH